MSADARAPRSVLVTGGVGFIGSAVCRLLAGRGTRVVNLDKLTYAGSLASLAEVEALPNYRFVRGDIGDASAVLRLLRGSRASGAAASASTMSRPTKCSATCPSTAASSPRRRPMRLPPPIRRRRRRATISSAPGTIPWAAGRALQLLEQLGAVSIPEKLVPLTILNAIEGKELPVYGRGANVRDWLHVEDHARALERVLAAGRVDETYLIGGRAERTNLQVVEAICDLVDARLGTSGRRGLIAFVADRPGHDRRYAIDPSKGERELGWRPRASFESGLARTVDWYVANRAWWEPIRAERPGAGLVPATEPLR